AIGSEKGICSSMRSTPASTIARAISSVASKLGYPSTMCVISRMSLSCRRRRISASSTIRLRLVDDERAPRGVVEGVRDGEDVFVAAARLVDEDRVVGREG